jgi:BA14K-like protein
MRLAVYGAVLAITLGNVLLGIDWLSAPMSPMVNTEAGLRASAALLPPAPAAKTGVSDFAAPVIVPPTVPNAKPGAPNIGARIIPPSLTAPTTPNVPTSVGTEVRTTPPEPIAVPEPQVTCNVEACTAAYRSFKASDCTYLPTGGTRRLCAK